jgi:histidinol dehydrogenase
LPQVARRAEGDLEKEIFSVYIQFIYELGGSNGITTVAMATMTLQDVLKIQFYGIF